MGRPKGLDNNNGEEQAVDVRQLRDAVRGRFMRLVAARQAAVVKISELEQDRKRLSQDLTAMLAEEGHKVVQTPDWRVTFVQGTHVTINEKKLLELGVPVKTIAKAKVRTAYETVSVTAVKEDK